MVEVTAKLIKQLRDKTSTGMMDCKKALVATKGNFEEAIDWLRKKGLSTASKKSNRITAEGLIGVATDNKSAILVEINSETDFVARNENFQNFVKDIANIALESDGSISHLKSLAYKQITVEEALVNLIATIGENLNIRRLAKIVAKNSQDAKDAKIFSYVHNEITAGLGKIGVIVALSSADNISDLGKQIAMHIAASKPKALDIKSLDSTLVEREKSIQREIALQSGKPVAIIEKMLEGRIAKFYQEVCLLEQGFILEPDKKVSQVLKEHHATINSYSYFILGDGIEKEVIDFAKEVKEVIN